MRFSPSNHLLMCLSLETLTPMIRSCLTILVELIDLVNSYNFSTSINLTQTINVPTQILNCDSHRTALMDLFLTLVFVLKWLSLHWEIMIMLLSQKTIGDCPASLYSLWPFLCWLEQSSVFHWTISLISVLLLLLGNCVSGLRLELMYTCLIIISSQVSIFPCVFSCFCYCQSS